MTDTLPVGREGHVALLDHSDVDDMSRYAWRLLRGHNGKLYAYAAGNADQPRTVYMHRLILGTPVGAETDHVNGLGLDNRRINLRVASASQNRANMGKPRRPDGGAHSSQYKGVSWDRSRERWQAKISTVDATTKVTRTANLGRFDDEVAAARAYDVAAREQWGPFAYLNLAEVTA